MIDENDPTSNESKKRAIRMLMEQDAFIEHPIRDEHGYIKVYATECKPLLGCELIAIFNLNDCIKK